MPVIIPANVCMSSKMASVRISHAATSSIRLGARPFAVAPRAAILALPPRHNSHDHGHIRCFSSTPSAHLKVKTWFPPPADAPKIEYAHPAWPHPGYSEEHMKAIEIAHRTPRNWADKTACTLMRVGRFAMDKCTFYSDKSATRRDSAGRRVSIKSDLWVMTERKWLIRMLFLETIAGVPGMVAAMLRHLRSLRRLKRDNGWIETLLEEAYNERMHLLTFMKLAEPGWFMKIMILGAQGVFFNGFFLSYLISPRICHRFVGYLEEEAVHTYTHIINELEAGNLPAWSDPKFQIPDIAINYWQMPEGKRTMKDLLYYIRADEAKHREVNHTLGNLEQQIDPNPFISTYKDASKPHPSKGIENIRSTGWERSDVI